MFRLVEAERYVRLEEALPERVSYPPLATDQLPEDTYQPLAFPSLKSSHTGAPDPGAKVGVGVRVGVHVGVRVATVVGVGVDVLCGVAVGGDEGEPL